MRWWLTILFGLLLAVKLTPSAAQNNSSKIKDELPQQQQGKDHLQKPVATGEACLIDERTSRQLEVQFRWPVQILVLANTGVDPLNESAVKNFNPVANVPLHHFYRILLFPFHSNT